MPGSPVAKQDVQLADDLIPISTTSSPVFDNFCRRQIQHFAQGIIIGKGRLVLSDPPELPVKSLNDIGCIYDFPNLRRICIKGRQDIPVVLPTLDARGVLFAPDFLERQQVLQRLLLGDSLIDLFQISHESLDILPTHISGTGANLVDDAALDVCLGICGGYGLTEAVETIHAEQVNVLYATALQVLQYPHPEF